jgi:hypothetical protein
MPVAVEDRPIGAVREETIDQLVANYGHGRLSLDAFERRLDQALEARSNTALCALTEDLEPLVDRAFEEAKERRFPPAPAEPRDGETDVIVNVFSGTKRKGPWAVPRRLSTVNVFGGADLDFSEALLSSETTRIRVFCVFGGVNIYVSERIRTVSKVLCVFGGVDDRAPPVSEANAPTLIIEGFALFGGVKVKLRKTLRKRLLEFADSVKSMFKPAY